MKKTQQFDMVWFAGNDRGLTGSWTLAGTSVPDACPSCGAWRDQFNGYLVCNTPTCDQWGEHRAPTGPAATPTPASYNLSAELTRLLAEITPLPWRYGGERNDNVSLSGGHNFREGVASFDDEGVPEQSNGDYAALAANALPLLAAERNRLVSQIKQMQAWANTLAYYALGMIHDLPRGLTVPSVKAEDIAKQVLLDGGPGIGAEVVKRINEASK